MNTKKILYSICLITGILYLLTSCEKDEKDQQELPYLFRPIGLQVSVKKTTATITWGTVDNATSYVIQISQDSLAFTNIIKSDSVTTNSYAIDLEFNMRYSIRVKAKANVASRDSKYNAKFTFKTPGIFDGYAQFMYDKGIASIYWMPGVAVTKLVQISPTGERTDIVLSEEEIATGHRMCNDLINGTYTFEIYGGDIQKGSTNVIIEGDVFVNSGEDLGAILTAITQDSAVVVIKPGIYSFSGGQALNRNIKIRGLYADSVPVLCMAGAAITATSNMFNIASTDKINFIQFENIDFAGYVGAATSGTKIGYLFNQGTACDVEWISFVNCKMHNIGNTPFRFKAASEKLENLVFYNCVINDIGYTSVYAIVNMNVASYINNIVFKNSTIYNFAGSLILHTTNSSNSVLIENCTFNEITTSGTGTSLRCLIDYQAANTVTNGITIKNCIFGSTPRAYTGGIRTNASTVISVSRSYKTSDFDDSKVVGFSIQGLDLYENASTKLFVSPLKGNFKFKDTEFKGKNTTGDPRWRP